ncbi:MAG: hypothetical protein POH28_15740 [Acidocella sp.]|nr:hypothetical protein [Acidocella sp.]
MSRKRTPTMAEIVALADTFRPLWRQGDVVRPWLRQHHGMLLELVHGDWSWAAIARAMTLAGITYRTGKSWNADWLQSEVFRARQPLKRHRPQNAQPPESCTSAATVTQAAVPAIMEAEPSASTAVPEEPEFQPASFIDWEATRAENPAPTTANASAPIIRPPAPAYDEVMARLLGKKPPS